MKRIFIRLCFLMTIAVTGGCASSGGNNAFLETHDNDNNGNLSRDEYHRSFDSMDTNKDGHLDDTELQKGHSGGGRR